MEAKGEIVVFDGFLKVYGRSGDDVLLPEVKQGDPLDVDNRRSDRKSLARPRPLHRSQPGPKARRNGHRPAEHLRQRPLTPSKTRGYVERGELEGVRARQSQAQCLTDGAVSTEATEKIQYGKDSNKLFPTDTGKVVTDFLVKHFAEVMDYDFTKSRRRRTRRHRRAAKRRASKCSTEFYTPFHKLVEASGRHYRAPRPPKPATSATTPRPACQSLPVLAATAQCCREASKLTTPSQNSPRCQPAPRSKPSRLSKP